MISISILIQDIISWSTSRRYFYWRLRRLLLELSVKQRIQKANPGFSEGQIKSMISRWFIEAQGAVNVSISTCLSFYYCSIRLFVYICTPTNNVFFWDIKWSCMSCFIWNGKIFSYLEWAPNSHFEIVIFFWTCIYCLIEIDPYLINCGQFRNIYMLILVQYILFLILIKFTFVLILFYFNGICQFK